MVGAREGVVDGLVLNDHGAVVGNDVAVEVVDGGLVLEQGRRQLGWPQSPMMWMRVLGKVIEDDKSLTGRPECVAPALVCRCITRS